MKLFVVPVFCVLAHTMKADNKKAVIKVLILKNIKALARNQDDDFRNRAVTILYLCL